jgi:hypothetical protein
MRQRFRQATPSMASDRSSSVPPTRHHQTLLGQLVDQLGEVGTGNAGIFGHLFDQHRVSTGFLEALQGPHRITRGLG